MLAGPLRDDVLRSLAGAWDDPEPGVRRHARRYSCEALIEEAGRRLPGAPDPFAAPRLGMVRDQLFRQGIADPRVLRADSARIKGDPAAKVWLVIAALLLPGAILGMLGLLTLAVAGIGLAIGAVGFVLFILGMVASLFIFFQANKLDDI